MISRHKSFLRSDGDYDITYSLMCDKCKKQPFDNGIGMHKIFWDFYDAVNYKKNNGWKSKNIYGKWIDLCPECKKIEEA